MTALKSQLLGLALGLITAIGCIFYEKLVHHFSLLGIVAIKIMEAIFILLLVLIFTPTTELSKDYTILSTTPKLYTAITIFILSGTTTIIWYLITKKQGVMVGSIYEVKYIVMLALIYILFGENKFTLNTVVGITLALGSIYFISKS